MKNFSMKIRADLFAGMRQSSLLLLTLLIFQGCAFFNIKKADQKTGLARGEAVIMGKIAISEDGDKLTPYSFFKRPSPTLFHAESGRYSWTVTGTDGSFSWAVPAGSYIIPEVQFGSFFIRPKLAFTAPEPGKAYYLGTVNIDITRLGTFGKDVQVNRVAVLDSFEAAQWPLSGELFSKTEKSLVFHDPTLPSDLTERESMTDSLIFFGTVPKR